MEKYKNKSGIYKITNPKGKIYIGQSSNIYIRYTKYRNLNCRSQPRIYASLNKYGFGSHQFEVIELCDKNILNDRERFYQEKFDCLSDSGLNCFITNTYIKKAKFRTETINTMKSKRQKRIVSKETGEKISNSLKGIKKSPEHVEKVRLALKGRKMTKEQIEKMSAASIGRKQSYSQFSRLFKKVICISTGEIYESLKQASEKSGINYGTLRNRLNGCQKNNTDYEYVIGKTKRGKPKKHITKELSHQKV